MQASFLQISDFHLDSKFLGLVDLEKISQRKKELEDTFKNIIQFANSIKDSLDFVVFAGDMFEGECFLPQTIKSLVIYGLESLKPLKVFIAAGNHDMLEEKSPYVIYDWPQNVHIFKPEFEKARIKDNVYLYGASVAAENKSRNILSGFKVENPQALNIAVMHGAETGGSEISIFGDCLPFSGADIIKSGVDYIALGHYHNCRPVPLSSDKVLGYYSGTPESVSFKEPGERFILKVDLRKGELPSVDKISFQKRLYKEIDLDCSAIVSSEEVKEALRSIGERDAILTINLTGAIDPDLRIDLEDLEDFVRQENLFFSARFKNITRPVYSKEMIESSLLGRNFLKIIEKYKDKYPQDILDAAERLGLDAIFTKEVRNWNEI
ncbi:MAG: metallophosphoesterase [Candidatus Omnitrophica bacterium]|nr:metallophosphoesterase [Candidatus Omnitrophota bacterium]